MEMIIRINFVNKEGGDHYEDITEIEFMRINSEYVDKVTEVYDAYDLMWNGGLSYDTYEEFVDEHDENKFVKENFDTIRGCICSWGLSELTEIINEIYPEANASLVQEDCEMTLEW